MPQHNQNTDNTVGATLAVARKLQLPLRKSIRLKGYDYSLAGLYFVSICCQDRICRFGKIENGKMILNEFGNIAYNGLVDLPNRFLNIELDVFIIMPNHIHVIIILNSQTNTTIADIVGAYKSLVSNGCLDIYKSKNQIMGKFWQRNYHEHIIRNEKSYNTISDYIENNPGTWDHDTLTP